MRLLRCRLTSTERGRFGALDLDAVGLRAAEATRWRSLAAGPRFSSAAALSDEELLDRS